MLEWVSTFSSFEETVYSMVKCKLTSSKICHYWYANPGKGL